MNARDYSPFLQDLIRKKSAGRTLDIELDIDGFWEPLGGHGCDRTAKEGEPRTFCGNVNSCPDCAARDLVQRLQGKGFFSSGSPDELNATITHWPKDPNGGIVDDLLNGKRIKNQF